MLTRLAVRSVRTAKYGHKGISAYSKVFLLSIEHVLKLTLKSAPPIQAANTGPVGAKYDSIMLISGAICFVWGMQIANTRGIFPPLI